MGNERVVKVKGNEIWVENVGEIMGGEIRGSEL